MQHAAFGQDTALDATGSPRHHQQEQQYQRQRQGQQQPLTTMQETTFPSSTSSPKSQMTSVDANISQTSQSTLASQPARELTPPSSISSSQDVQVEGQKGASEDLSDGGTTPSTVTGKKRTANGQVKDTADVRERKRLSLGLGYRTDVDSTLAPGVTNLAEVYLQTPPHDDSNADFVKQLSQQLKTKLTYAMVKVQNGWQKHSLDEIESITSQSPRSILSGAAPCGFQSMMSPRAALMAGKRQHSEPSNLVGPNGHHQPHVPSLMTAPDPAVLHQRKALAPPAAIVAGNRRRSTLQTQLETNGSTKASPRSSRPHPAQRTPSQNAAMEADAVETLLFMSTSPSTSAHFPSHMSAYSPTSQTFSAQNSPLKSHFSSGVHGCNYSNSSTTFDSPRRYTHTHQRRVRHEDKAALIDRLLDNLDDDESDDLDQAVKIIEQHRAAKLST